MKTLPIDVVSMEQAIAPDRTQYGCVFLENTGYLNRDSGEIVFVYANEAEVRGFMGEDCAIDTVFDRAAVEASPETWIEIPKYDLDDDNRYEFIVAFLRQHGLDW